MNKIKSLLKIKKDTAIFIASILIPLMMALWIVLTGNIPLWYDNARDLLAAWDNHANPTLIGPPSGIAGIFYGPYWIWLLSIALVLSKDPRIVDLIVGIFPYFVIFPFILYKFTRIFSTTSIIIVWLMFIFNIGMSYVTNMWNPHLAPLFTLILIYTLVFGNYSSQNFKKYLHAFFAGVIAGLVINFHISLGVGVLLGAVIFIMVKLLLSIKSRGKDPFMIRLAYIPLFLGGVFTTFTPFLLFEIRHGFNQVQAIFNTLSSLGGNVAVEGLGQMLILEIFLGRLNIIFGFSAITYIFIFISFCYLILKIVRKDIKINGYEKDLLILLACITFGILFTYLTAKNPVWAYHFIGVEVIFILLIAFFITKLTLLRLIFIVWVSIFTASKIITFVDVNIGHQEKFSDSVSVKREILEIVIQDADDDNYSFFAYSPSIYVFEYSYLFRWIGKKEVSYDPGMIKEDAEVVYLVVPKIQDELIEDFIEYRSASRNYETSRNWEINSDIIILKRERRGIE